MFSIFFISNLTLKNDMKFFEIKLDTKWDKNSWVKATAHANFVTAQKTKIFSCDIEEF